MSEPAPDIVHRGTTPVRLDLAYRSAGAFLVAYATNLAKGGLFVETADPLPAGTPLVLRLHAPPDAVICADGFVSWSRSEPPAPGHPIGMALALSTPPEIIGADVDRIAFGFSGMKVLLGTAESAPRAILSRYLRSILGCLSCLSGLTGRTGGLVDVDEPADPSGEHGDIDLAVIDLDSSGTEGVALYERLRGRPRTASAPAIALAQLERDRERAMHIGFDEVLANPPPFTDLQAAVLRSLARPILVR